MSGITGIKRKSNAVRATATNGSIKITYRLKKGEVQVPTAVKKENFRHWSMKRGLWWDGNKYTMEFNHGYFLGNGVQDASSRTYPFLIAGGTTDESVSYKEKVQFIGLVEHGRWEGSIVTLHVSVRGVIHVPRWWFTTTELRTCHHSILGRLYSKRQDDLDRVTNALSEVKRNHDNPDFPGSNRHVGKLITVFFRV